MRRLRCDGARAPVNWCSWPIAQLKSAHPEAADNLDVLDVIHVDREEVAVVLEVGMKRQSMQSRAAYQPMPICKASSVG